MASLKEYGRRALLPLVGLGLTAYYLAVLLPLAHRADALDEPLQKAWRRLATSLEQSNSLSLDFLHVTNQLAETRQAMRVLEEARKKALARLELNPAVEARLVAPFQLVEFENERAKQRDELESAAQARQVKLGPGVLSGFPVHTADMQEPALLWAALAFTDGLLDTAVGCRVSSLDSLEVPLGITNALARDPGHLLPVQVHLEFTATADNALKVIQSLPLRGSEVGAAGLPEASKDKLPLFIERLLIKKQNPERLDEVHVWLRAVGFVLGD